ncbi:anti-sigma factor [Geodermatophilus sp. TF02-6]|uniref:anti-sigma factor n=1 Tax=Geodermatophilus sp. TF02-6 TaxID=2250575 RepID=UPI000DE8030D|nr:anti-sigma factor [Geodermatophilus sp. TF02-6]RBY76707.1 anti-sigma factor [Geodermatophilus sp. TF02-6]
MREDRGGAPRRGEHEVFDELAVGWALHALEPEEESLFAAHLPECARCRRTVTETGEVMGAMATGLTTVDPPERLRERLRAAVEETDQVSAPPPVPDRPVRPAPAAPAGATRWTEHPAAASPGVRPPATSPGFRPSTPVGRRVPPSAWRRVLPNALVAAAVAAILALGTWNVLLSSARDDAQATAARQQELVNALLTPGHAAIAPLSGNDGTPLATVIARNGQVQVVTHGLRPNDTSEQTYVVWGTAEGLPVPLGTFDVVSSRMDLRTVGSASTGLDDYTGYAVSLEPGRRMPARPTEIVADGEVTS